MILDKKSALCVALVSMVLHCSLVPILWAQSHPMNSVKETPERASAFKGKDYTFFSLAKNGTGFVPKLKALIADIPLGLNLANTTWANSAVHDTYLLSLMHVLLVNTVEYHPHFTQGERAQLLVLVDLAPSFFSNRVSYYYKLVVLDRILEGMEAETRALINTPKIGKVLRQDIHSKLYEIRNIRSQLGVSERKINNTEEWLMAAPGDWLVFNPHQKIYVYAQKLGPTK
jgi:hypothetical protein